MGKYYNPYNYDDLHYIPFSEECEQPARDEIMVMSDEELKDVPLREQVALLRAQVDSLGETLSRCINILNTFQHTSTEYMQFVDAKAERAAYEIHKHSDCFHAMLIVGHKHKEKDKDESDIP